jgi:hypothetical protein
MPFIYINGPLPAVDYESITVSTVSIGCTASKLLVQTVLSGTSEGRAYIDNKRVDEALFTVETNPVRFRLDGTDPTAAEGHLLQAGDSIVVTGYSNLSKLRFIRQGAADGTVKATYYRKS